MKEPARLLGIGQTGVGKTTLLRSIFRIADEHVEQIKDLRVNPVVSDTKVFRSFTEEAYLSLLAGMEWMHDLHLRLLIQAAEE